MLSRPGPQPHVPPKSVPKFALGAMLRAKTAIDPEYNGGCPFVGRVEAIFADYWAARDVGVVRKGWFAVQKHKPKTKDQPFYSLVAIDGVGAVLVGETDAEEA
jgi:hypothetical protein